MDINQRKLLLPLNLNRRTCEEPDLPLSSVGKTEKEFVVKMSKVYRQLIK